MATEYSLLLEPLVDEKCTYRKNLAEAVGVATSTISDFCKGKIIPKESTAMKIHAALKLNDGETAILEEARDKSKRSGNIGRKYMSDRQIRQIKLQLRDIGLKLSKPDQVPGCPQYMIRMTGGDGKSYVYGFAALEKVVSNLDLLGVGTRANYIGDLYSMVFCLPDELVPEVMFDEWLGVFDYAATEVVGLSDLQRWFEKEMANHEVKKSNI